jgi:hypothetical protein
MTSEDDRIAYLTGDPGVPVHPAERAELDELRGLLADPAVWAEPDPALQERVVEAISTSAAAPARPVPDPARAAPPAARDRAARHRRRHMRRVRHVLLGVAAAVVLAAGIGVGISVFGGTTAHPLEYTAALTGTELAPGATGQVSLTQTTGGWRISLQATGLPRLDNGQYYEAWLKNPAGMLVPVGTFNQPTDITLWSGVPPSSYPVLTVTRQQANGNPASSGQPVLTGTTHRTH